MRVAKPILPLLILVVLFCFFSNLNAQANSCIACHSEMEDELKAPVEAYQMDVHQKYGLTCVDCHGGNSAEEDIDSAKDRTFKGSPDRKQIPRFCGSCHSDSQYMRKYNPGIRVDQLVLYKTSEHGRLLEKGDTEVAVCTDCHGIHGILASTHPRSWTFPWNIPQTCGRCHSSEEYMKNYKISTKHVDEYKESVHARALFEKKDLSAPVCNDCHGNHSASPPGVESVAFVCRQCHPSAGDLFSESPHNTSFKIMGESECEVCHGSHKILTPSDEMLGTGDKAVCIQCHEPESKAYGIAKTIKSRLEGFKTRIKESKELLEKADNQGVEVSEPRFKLQEANTILIQVRNLVHGFSLNEIEEMISDGNTILDDVKLAGEAALREAKFRKEGLVVATFFLFLLAVALFFKIRQIEKKTSS